MYDMYHMYTYLDSWLEGKSETCPPPPGMLGGRGVIVYERTSTPSDAGLMPKNGPTSMHSPFPPYRLYVYTVGPFSSSRT